MLEPTPQLSRRDYFAAMAMQGILSNSKGLSAMIRSGEKEGLDHLEVVAGVAVTFADALITELDRTTPKSDA